MLLIVLERKKKNHTPEQNKNTQTNKQTVNTEYYETMKLQLWSSTRNLTFQYI